MKKLRMTEKQATIAYFKGKINKTDYHNILRRIAENRYKKSINNLKVKTSMSSSKWK